MVYVDVAKFLRVITNISLALVLSYYLLRGKNFFYAGKSHLYIGLVFFLLFVAHTITLLNKSASGVSLDQLDLISEGGMASFVFSYLTYYRWRRKEVKIWHLVSIWVYFGILSPLGA